MDEITGYRLHKVKAYAVSTEDAVIIEITVQTGEATGEQLPRFFVRREDWAQMVSLVSTAFALPQ